jgi:N-carbamoylputrescine amidase
MVGEARTIRVAAVQMESKNGMIAENLARATVFVEKAVRQGAQLILLPELMPTGYLLTEEIWDGAEPSHGPTVRWLAETSRRFGVWLGTSFLEAKGEDFYNTFVLTAPEGHEAGRVRKNPPISVEAYFFKGVPGSHVIETEFGRIGVGICGENIYCETLCTFYAESVDMVLQPSSAATPMKMFPFSARSIEAFDKMLQESPRIYAHALGVPVVFANKCGPLDTPLPKPFPRQRTRFPGLSAIADSDAVMKIQLGGEEGVIVTDVSLDPARKAQTPPRCNGYWSVPVPWYACIWPPTEKLGRSAYASNLRRRERARVISMMFTET